MLHTILSVQLGKALSSELGAFLYAKCAIIPEEMHSNLQSVPIVTLEPISLCLFSLAGMAVHFLVPMKPLEP
mgnify:CR=1 FL=1